MTYFLLASQPLNSIGAHALPWEGDKLNFAIWCSCNLIAFRSENEIRSLHFFHYQRAARMKCHIIRVATFFCILLIDFWRVLIKAGWYSAGWPNAEDSFRSKSPVAQGRRRSDSYYITNQRRQTRNNEGKCRWLKIRTVAKIHTESRAIIMQNRLCILDKYYRCDTCAWFLPKCTSETFENYMLILI